MRQWSCLRQRTRSDCLGALDVVVVAEAESPAGALPDDVPLEAIEQGVRTHPTGRLADGRRANHCSQKQAEYNKTDKCCNDRNIIFD